MEREKNTHCACFSTYYSPFMTPKESATKQTPSSIPPPPPPQQQQSLLSSSFSVSSKKSVFLGLLRKARTERRANLATRHLRRGEFARYFRETTTKKNVPHRSGRESDGDDQNAETNQSGRVLVERMREREREREGEKEREREKA